MALALWNPAPLEPELVLAQAISDLESSLTSNEKSRLHGIRSAALRSTPTTQDVMRFTADINSQIRTSSPITRCLGTRFTNFLHSVQRYAALGDVVVGGSQNIIACGVWAAVRMTIEVGDPLQAEIFYIIQFL